ncbi:hypothetical protein [Brevibacillus laterosporus]|uniref:hypothetical protein n=1 Tax=Brevibacillus laterosporus TaxID=1465 RepID=UPI001F08B159|nr:hypothetical protein [Brevibacillus laterosporus]
MPAELYAQYDWNGRMIKYHRAQIREFFGFRENTVQDSQEMSEWLCQHILHHSQEWEHVKDTVLRTIPRTAPTPRSDSLCAVMRFFLAQKSGNH